MSKGDLENTIATYRNSLADYPIKIIRSACKDWIEGRIPGLDHKDFGFAPKAPVLARHCRDIEARSQSETHHGYRLADKEIHTEQTRGPKTDREQEYVQKGLRIIYEFFSGKIGGKEYEIEIAEHQAAYRRDQRQGRT